MEGDRASRHIDVVVRIVSGQTSTVTFNNVLKRGDLKVVKTSEDNMNEGVKFRLHGTSLSGLKVAQLHGSGILNNAEYAVQAGELNRRASELRSERRRILMEDEDNEIIESLKALNDTIADYTPTGGFDEELFGQIVESVTVISGNVLRFCLAGGLALTEKI